MTAVQEIATDVVVAPLDVVPEMDGVAGAQGSDISVEEAYALRYREIAQGPDGTRGCVVNEGDIDDTCMRVPDLRISVTGLAEAIARERFLLRMPFTGRQQPRLTVPLYERVRSL